MELTKEQIRTLLHILHKAEYEFVTANHLYVTDRPEAVPDNIKFMSDFTEIYLKHLKKHKFHCPFLKRL